MRRTGRPLGGAANNGRIYDPFSGRFLSPDPFVQSPGNLQNYNRYGYVLNNPLSYTDPSGYFFKKLFRSVARFVKQYWTTIVTIALSFVPVVGPWLAMAFNTAVGAYYGGLRGALVGLASGMVAAQIGTFFDGLQGAAQAAASGAYDWGVEFMRAMAHGISQGGLSEIGGGDFASGFLSAGFGSAAGSFMSSPTGERHFGKAGDSKGRVVRTVTAAIVGGTASKLGGGKFQNGAMTAAMVHLFNHEGLLKVAAYDPDEPGGTDPSTGDQLASSKDFLGAARAAGLSDDNLIAAKSLDDVVARLELLGMQGKIDVLYFWDHSNSSGQYLGEAAIGPREFRRLAPFLADEGIIVFLGCDVGSNLNYLRSVSQSLAPRRGHGPMVWGHHGPFQTSSVNGRYNPIPLPDRDRRMFGFAGQSYWNRKAPND